MIEFEYIVVGNGLFGSAAARHLTNFSQSVAVIGPDEPQDQTNHDGVFASHYDQRRLTRLIGRSKLWVDITRIAVDNYRHLEAQSGIRFFDPVGVLIVKADHLKDNYQESPVETAKRENIPHTHYPVGNRSWQSKFPAYDFPKTHWVLHEPITAGMIDPRAMLKAQLKISRLQGAAIIPQIVTSVEEKSDSVYLTTRSGEVYRAQKIVLATGAFSNYYKLLPQKLALQPKSEVVLLAQVSEADAAQLRSLPTISYTIDDPEISDIYMTPPVQYENGRFYFKMGANTISDLYPTTLAQTQTWFQSGNSNAHLPALKKAICAILPQVNFLSFETKRCIIARTPSQYPMIDQLSDRLFVAVGGNGSSAKAADAWGKLAAGLAHDGRWINGIPRENLRAVFRK